MGMKDSLSALQSLANKIGDSTDTDVALINASIDRPLDKLVLDACHRRIRRKNITLILITEGGSADIAYRVSRCFQDNYSKFTILISGVCKSAGTIIALGANEVAIGRMGELGPLDVQLRKADELWELSSGMTAMDALSTIQDRAFRMFEKYLIDLKERSQGQITLKTAAEIAGNLTTGLYGKVYAQIDPMKLGETSRAMSIARHYGDRLATKGGNLKPDTVVRLTAGYPTHSFVIDKGEAETLFKNVRVLNAEEEQIIDLLGELAYSENIKRGPIVEFLSGEPRLSSDIVTSEGASDDGKGIKADNRRDSKRTRPSAGEPSGVSEQNSSNGHRSAPGLQKTPGS